MSRFVLSLVIVSSFFVLHAQTKLSKNVRKDLRKTVLAYISSQVVSDDKLMEQMIVLYNVKSYEKLKIATTQLKNRLDDRGYQNLTDVEFTTYLDLQQAHSPVRRHTI